MTAEPISRTMSSLNRIVASSSGGDGPRAFQIEEHAAGFSSRSARNVVSRVHLDRDAHAVGHSTALDIANHDRAAAGVSWRSLRQRSRSCRSLCLRSTSVAAWPERRADGSGGGVCRRHRAGRAAISSTPGPQRARSDTPRFSRVSRPHARVRDRQPRRIAERQPARDFLPATARCRCSRLPEIGARRFVGGDARRGSRDAVGFARSSVAQRLLAFERALVERPRRAAAAAPRHRHGQSAHASIRTIARDI